MPRTRQSGQVGPKVHREPWAGNWSQEPKRRPPRSKEALDARKGAGLITADKVVLELANIAFGKPTSVMTWGPGGVIVRTPESLAPEEAALVSEVVRGQAHGKGALLSSRPMTK